MKVNKLKENIISGKEVKEKLKKFLGNKIALAMNDIIITDVLTYDEEYRAGIAILLFYDDCNYRFETSEYIHTHIRIEKIGQGHTNNPKAINSTMAQPSEK